MNQIDICNQALALLGDRRITRLDDAAQQSDPLARYCAEFYPTARREALAAHRWSFAKASAVLVRREDVPAIGKFTYTHVRPTACLRVMTLLQGQTLVDGVPTVYAGGIDSFELVGKDIKSNHLHVALEFIQDVITPADWSPHFVPAVVTLLASYLAGPIADDDRKSGQLRDLYERVSLPNAQFYDSVQDNSGENNDSGIRRAGDPLLQSRYKS